MGRVLEGTTVFRLDLRLNRALDKFEVPGPDRRILLTSSRAELGLGLMICNGAARNGPAGALRPPSRSSSMERRPSRLVVT
jgi:hypothetical protein